MKKTLLLYSRVCVDESLHTVKIFNELKQLDNIVAIKLDDKNAFEWEKEQKFIEQFDNIIFLFTINWFNIPWNLSRYLTEVWKGNNLSLKEKNVYNIITAGGFQTYYSPTGKYGHKLEEYLINLNSIYKMMKLNKANEYIYYGAANYDEKKLNDFIDMLKDEYKVKISKI